MLNGIVILMFPETTILRLIEQNIIKNGRHFEKNGRHFESQFLYWWHRRKKWYLAFLKSAPQNWQSYDQKNTFWHENQLDPIIWHINLYQVCQYKLYLRNENADSALLKLRKVISRMTESYQRNIVFLNTAYNFSSSWCVTINNTNFTSFWQIWLEPL